MKRPKKFTRRELYDRVWSKSVLQNANEIGISPNALGKICKRAKIPVPTRGYWAKKQAGKAVQSAHPLEGDTAKIVTVYYWPTAPSRKQAVQTTVALA